MSIGSTATATHDATETIVGVGPSTVIHDQHIFNSETRLVAELGVTSWLAASLVFPVRVFDTSIRYLDPAGQPVMIENPYVHHHDETLAGPGDPWLMARFARVLGGFTLGARAGFTVPLGRTEEDPFVLGDMGIPHEHTQFGTGTIEPVLAIDASRTFGPVRVEAFALTVQSLYANGHGYQAGDRYAGGVAVASSLGTQHWRLRGTFEAQHETAETWHGIVHTDEGNTGRTDLLAGLEATWRVTDDWHLGASLKLPLYTHVQGGQLQSSVFVGLSVGTQLHLFEHDDEHAHHHEHAAQPAADWSGLDMREVSTDGRVVPLEPVAGKITVFDFWATWCEPCGVLDHQLAELARRHPGDIAVRKIDVVDVDSPASQKLVRDYTLPHVKVFGRDGKLLWEHSAPPIALAAEIESLVTAPPATAPPPAPSHAARRIQIEVTDAGYQPARIEIRRGVPVTLVFTRKSQKTCATDVHFVLPDGRRIDETLPLDRPVSISIDVKRPGQITYACGMDMVHGTIDVR